MKHTLQAVAIIAGLSLVSTVTLASSEIDRMSDIEVSEYATRMANVMETIKNRQLCELQDARCVRDEFTRHGLSYDDKEQVQKRLAPMIGSIH